MSTTTHNLAIWQRRREVAYLKDKEKLTQEEIGKRLGVDQSVISDDIKALKEMAQQFIHDLAIYYMECVDGISSAEAEVWTIYKNGLDLSVKDRLDALRLIIYANESKAKLISEGPKAMAMHQLEQRVAEIELSGQIAR